jgi:hypothetical protein
VRSFKDPVEHPSHCENGRACVEDFAAGGNDAHFSAWSVRPFQNGHVESLKRELDGGNQSANPGSNDHNSATWVHPLQDWRCKCQL